MANPEAVSIDGELYPIATSYKVAIECDKIARDVTISDYERTLAIIYKLFGEKGLKAIQHHARLQQQAIYYLQLGKVEENSRSRNRNEKRDMDYEQDMDYIKASFMSDYHLNLDEQDMHWWTFCNLIEGLSNSELGNCCVFNRVRNIRNKDLSKITDGEEKRQMRELKERVALKEEIVITEEQRESANRFFELTGIDKKR